MVTQAALACSVAAGGLACFAVLFADALVRGRYDGPSTDVAPLVTAAEVQGGPRPR